MKEASGELNMTLITIVAIAIIGGIFALFWPKIKDAIDTKWSDGVKSTESNNSQLNG